MRLIQQDSRAGVGNCSLRQTFVQSAEASTVKKGLKFIDKVVKDQKKGLTFFLEVPPTNFCLCSLTGAPLAKLKLQIN